MHCLASPDALPIESVGSLLSWRNDTRSIAEFGNLDVVPAADLVLAVNSQHMRDAKQISTHAYANMCARQDPQLTDKRPREAAHGHMTREPGTRHCVHIRPRTTHGKQWRWCLLNSPEAGPEKIGDRHVQIRIGIQGKHKQERRQGQAVSSQSFNA